MKRKNRSPLRWIAAGVAVLFLFSVTAVVLSADTEEAAPDAYRYDPEGKPDPFKPFIEIVEERKEVAKTVETVPPPPLQRFAVGEFRLTGIVWTTDKKIAIVETPERKKYTIRRGTPLGVNGGRVVKIGPDSVVVLEKIKDFSGNIHTEQVILALKKNGGNP
ncbi:MAG: pilus assembly protein PilP [Syntrophales bacterium]|nr:pilus assembly protein PilP [Syntrophales bacterium]